LHLANPQERNSHDGDDDTGNEVENSSIDVFSGRPHIVTESIEGANDSASDN
jgi:hypothetical protein